MIKRLQMVLLLTFLFASSTVALSPPEIYRKAVKSVVYIDTLDKDGTWGSGTGFLAVGPDIVITSWHVVKDAKAVRVMFEDGEKVYSPGWIDRSLRQDIVMMSAATRKRPRLKLLFNTPPIGTPVYTLGAPNGWQYTFLDGIVSQYRGTAGINYTQVSCLCTYGSSGSPLLDKDGNVIGIIDSIDSAAPGITFAIETNILKKLYPGAPLKVWE